MKSLDEIEKLAELTLNVEDPNDDYPPCERCNSFMESADGDPSKFCASCIYEVADALARALLAVLPVVRAAEAWLDHLDRPPSRYLDGIPGELFDAFDAMRAKLAGEG